MYYSYRAISALSPDSQSFDLTYCPRLRESSTFEICIQVSPSGSHSHHPIALGDQKHWQRNGRTLEPVFFYVTLSPFVMLYIYMRGHYFLHNLTKNALPCI